MNIPPEVAKRIHLWTLEGRGAIEIAALLEGKYSRHQIGNLKTKHGWRFPVEYNYERRPRIMLDRCMACGADKSLPCPVPRCERYDGGEPVQERTLAGVTSAW